MHTTHHLLNKKSRGAGGFTLIELLVVTGITGMLLLAVSSLFMTVLVGRAQSNYRNQLHTSGNEMIGRMEFLLRNSISADCTASPVVLETITNDKISFRLNTSDKTIIMTTNAVDEVLSSASVTVESFTLACTTDPSTQKKSVKVEFILKHAETQANVNETFTTWVQLRNS